jgi:hypothetical protein
VAAWAMQFTYARVKADGPEYERGEQWSIICLWCWLLSDFPGFPNVSAEHARRMSNALSQSEFLSRLELI